MVKKKQRSTALFLVICMVLSMFTSIPAKAAEGKGLAFWWWHDDEGVFQKDDPCGHDEEGRYGCSPGTNNIYIEVDGEPVESVEVKYVGSEEDDTNEADRSEEYKSLEEAGYFTIDFHYGEGKYIISASDTEYEAEWWIGLPDFAFYNQNNWDVDNYISDDIYYEGGKITTFYIIPRQFADDEEPWEEFPKEYYVGTNYNEDRTDVILYTIDEKGKRVEKIELGQPVTTDQRIEVTIPENKSGDFFLYLRDPKEEDEDNWLSCIWCREKMTGLMAKTWIDWQEDNYYGPMPEAEWEKNIEAQLSGIALYLVYLENEDDDELVLSKDDITVLKDGKPTDDAIVECRPNDDNPDLIDFRFHKVGTYTIQYKKGNVTYSINMYVDYPTIGFYKEDRMDEDTFISELRYERGTEEKVYVIPNLKKEWTSAKYSIGYEWKDGDAEVTVNGESLPTNTFENDEGYDEYNSMEIDADEHPEVVITGDSKDNFSIFVETSFKNEWGDTESRRESLYCEDIHGNDNEVQDGKTHSGFEGWFLPKDAYDDMDPWGDYSDWRNEQDGKGNYVNVVYRVHGDTVQDVINDLLEVKEKDGKVEYDGRKYNVLTSGYMYIRSLAFPHYSENVEKAQYITDSSEVSGIIFESGGERPNVKTEWGYQEATKLQPEESSDTVLYCYYDDDYYEDENGEEIWFQILREIGKDSTAETGYKYKDEGGYIAQLWTDDGPRYYAYDNKSKSIDYEAEYIENYDWEEEWVNPLPNLHIDAGEDTEVKVVNGFNGVDEENEDAINVYFALNSDSKSKLSLHDGDGYAERATYASGDIGTTEFVNKRGVFCRVKIVGLDPVTETVVTGSDDFKITEDNVTIDTKGQDLSKKINLNELLEDEDVLHQYIDGEEQLKITFGVDATVSKVDAIKTLAEKEAGKNVVSKIQYLGITLDYALGEAGNSIEAMKGDIGISINLPDGFVKKVNKAAKEVKPVVYRYYGDTAEKLEDVEYDEEAGTIAFETNQFAVYAIVLEEVVPTGIKITKAPTKTTYTVGEKFDANGMEVKLEYSDASAVVLKATDYTVSNTAALKVTDKTITVVYVDEDGNEYSAPQAITVTEAATQAPTTQEPTTQAPTTQAPETTEAPKAGETKTVDGNKYKVTDAAKGKETVTYTGSEKKTDKVSVPSTIKIGETSYKVTAIGDNAFSGNTKLTSVTIPSSVTKIGKNAFKGCTKLKKVTIPKNVTSIGANAFYNCKKLTSVTFKGTKLTKIGDGAFQKCASLKSVTIPKSVTEIGKNAFNGCKKLSKVTFKGTKIKKIGKNAFKNIAKKPTIKVPKSKKTAYKKLLKKAGYTKTVK